MASVPLVERQHVLDHLEGELEAAVAAAGAGRMVLLAGMAGVGKTSVVRALADRAGPPVRVLWGACDALATPRPLGPLLDMADDLPGLDLDAAERHGLFAAVVDELRSRRSLVIIEDIHWADEATLDLLVHLGRRIDRTRALVVATYRAEEVGPDHPLQAVLGTLATAPGHRRQALEPLSPAGVATLVGDREIDADRLHRVTGGNPFYVTEVLGTPGWVVPPTVADAVRARARRLPDGARAVLDAVSVEPRPVELAHLAALGHHDNDVDRAIAGGMLVHDRGRVSFRHELARLAIADALAPTARRGLHRSWFALLAGDQDAKEGPGDANRDTDRDADPDPARLAHHAKGGGDDHATLRWSRRAARVAVRSGAHREAAAHFLDAVERAGDLPPSERADLVAHLAGELALVDRGDEAMARWREVVELRREAGDEAGHVVARTQLARAVWRVGDGPAARRIMDAAVDAADRLLGGSPVEDAAAGSREAPPEPGDVVGRRHAAAFVYAWAGYIAMLARHGERSRQLATRAIDLARPAGFDDVMVPALNALGSTMIVSDHDTAGIAPLEESHDIAAVHGWHGGVEDALNNLGSALGEIRQYDLAGRWLAEAIEFSRDHDMDAGFNYSTAWLGRVRFEQGRWTEALDVVADLPTDGGISPISPIVSQTVVGRIRARRGDPPRGELAQAWELARRTNDLQRLWPTIAGRAEAAWLVGDVADQVRADLAEVYELALRLQVAWAVGELASWLDRLDGPAAWRDPRAAWLEDAVEDTGAVEDGAGAGPARADTAMPYALQLAGRHLAAAAAWEELGSPYEQAWALADHGDEPSLRRALELLDDLGARPLAARVRARLRDVGATGIPAGPRRATTRHPAGLTARQAEVLELVAAGLTDRQVAERLFISPKTVGHHVSAVLATLGVDSRTAAASLAHEEGWLATDGARDHPPVPPDPRAL